MLSIMSQKQIILIGGAPTAGKSYIAKRLAKDLGLPWISTDTIREMMRRVVSKEDFPHLLHTERYTAERYFQEFTTDQVVEHQITESGETWRGVKALIETDYVWGSFLVEGVGILPHLVSESFKGDLSVKPLFLLATNKERIREVVYTRGLWGEAKSYPDSVKEREVEWAYAFSMWLKSEAEKYGYPTFEITELDVPFEKISLQIQEKLR